MACCNAFKHVLWSIRRYGVMRGSSPIAARSHSIRSFNGRLLSSPADPSRLQASGDPFADAHAAIPLPTVLLSEMVISTTEASTLELSTGNCCKADEYGPDSQLQEFANNENEIPGVGPTVLSAFNVLLLAKARRHSDFVRSLSATVLFSPFHESHLCKNSTQKWLRLKPASCAATLQSPALPGSRYRALCPRHGTVAVTRAKKKAEAWLPRKGLCGGEQRKDALTKLEAGDRLHAGFWNYTTPWPPG